MSTDTTTTSTISSTSAGTLEALVDGVLSAYCDPDRERREARIAELWTADGELLDPPLAGRGHAELGALTDVVLTHYPDHIFRRTSAVDAHHGHARYAWDLVGPTGAVAVSGVDLAEFTPDGRMRRVVGFFGPLPHIA